MKWILALHLMAVIAWFAGLFYLPRLFVYHTQVDNQLEPKAYARFCTMERKLWYYIMTPAAIITLITGHFLMVDYELTGQPMTWLYIKLALVALVCLFHIACWFYWRGFVKLRNQHSERFYRIINEVPTLLMVSIVLLAVIRP